MTLLHEEAIYLHQGKQFQVEVLDFDEKKAFVREVDVDYYTDANLAVQLRVLEVEQTTTPRPEITYSFGEVTVNAMATIFKKIKFETHENIGSGPIHLPEQEMHTNAAWISFPAEWTEKLGREKLERGLMGISHVLRHVAVLFVMCDANDLHVVPQVKATHSEQPTIFLYDRYPGGVGLSEEIYRNMEQILNEVQFVIDRCPCREGCPSCIGTDGEGKRWSLQLLSLIRGEGDSFVVER